MPSAGRRDIPVLENRDLEQTLAWLLGSLGQE